ncbi:interleukin-17D [Gadus macrocephalus]|uniref:interleukin-17D n=1 Tax=Gadus macrocephalus TaxID=80720 RepID=UPI0028CB83AE|nr:interleukin-17D [Gadus macrocephalus]
MWWLKRRATLLRLGVLVLLLYLLQVAAADVTRAGRVKKKKPVLVASSRTRRCLDLQEEILEQMLGRLSVGVLQAFHQTLQIAPSERHNLTCPAAGRLLQSDSKTRVPVNLLSLSPWAYRISHDPLRYPRFIPEAYCLCTGCLTGPGGKESVRHRSTPVYTPSVILRRTGACVAGRHSYVESYVSLAVGCTCVPLLAEDREAQSGNQSLDRVAPKHGGETGVTNGNKIVYKTTTGGLV